MALKERLRARFGPTTMHVEPGKLTLRDGTVKTTGKYGQPIGNAIAEALRQARPGEVIGVRGVHDEIVVGGGNDHWDSVAFWPNNEPIEHVALVADDDAPGPAAIRGVTIQADRGGIEDFSLWGLELRNRVYAKYAVLVAMLHQTGKLSILSCSMVSEDPSAWNGWGKMWGLRAEGLLDGLDMIDNDCGDAQEHPVVYSDNLGWRSGRRSKIMHNRVGPRGGGRTCIQLTNRGRSGPSGGGIWEVSNNDLRVTDAGGGYAITVAGGPDAVIVKNNRIRGDGNHGGIVFWSDAGKGLYKTPDGFTCGHALLEDNSIVMPAGEYPHVALSGVREIQVKGPFLIQGGKTCIDLWNSYGGPVDNGRIEFLDLPAPLSGFSGFQAGVKIRRRNITLTPAQIDSLLVQPSAVAP